MRIWKSVPMITLCLLLTACGGTEEKIEDLRSHYQNMSGCTMEAVVSCEQEGLEWESTLRCDYVPGGKSTVEVVAPETIAGVRVVFDDQDWRLEYQEDCLNIGSLSKQEMNPATCLPRLMEALREGWLLEENAESWQEVPCVRLCLDQSGSQNGEIISAIWLRQEDGTPLRGEISADGEIILTAEFTEFLFYDKISPTDAAS